ncbi:VOC family protein [Streptomyces sp. NPDC086783]|uniref:VOC family protein n=1 Tax=Streptomyces sp. NPDC086783 TaxID=3365758 RepID=UPI003819A89F
MIPANAIDETVAFYERLQRTSCHMRFVFPHKHLEVAGVGNILVIAGDDEALEPFRSTGASIVVDDIRWYATYLAEAGAEIVEAPFPVSVGSEMRVRHADGLLVNYVEHRPGPIDDSLTSMQDIQ